MPIKTLEIPDGIIVEDINIDAGGLFEYIENAQVDGKIKSPKLYRLGSREIINATPLALEGNGIQWFITADELAYNGLVSITGNDRDLNRIGVGKQDRRVEISRNGNAVLIGKVLPKNRYRLYTVIYWSDS